MTPQKRLQLEEQHQENLAKLVSGHNPHAARLPPGVLQLWFTFYKELLKEVWSSGLNRELSPKQIWAEVNEHKDEILAGTKGTPDWERMAPVDWKHYWVWHGPKLGSFLKELDKRLSAEIARWFELAQEADQRRRMSIARNIEHYRRECGFTLQTLAEAMELSIDTIKSHTRTKNPKTPNVETMCNYADLFSNKLDISLTPHSLAQDPLSMTQPRGGQIKTAAPTA